MKLWLLEDYLIGSRKRVKGEKIDTDDELGQLLISSGIAKSEAKINSKHKKR